jgi:uncharacterized protein (TIGR02246 family)
MVNGFRSALWFLIAWAMFGASRLSLAQEQTAAPGVDGAGAAAADVSPEVAAIRAGSAAFVEAFNRGDAKALAALWTQDGEYIDETGHKYEGREEIEKGYAEFFAAHPKATLRLVEDSVRLLSPDAAIEDGEAVLEPPDGSDPTASKYSVVHVKQDGRWLMASVRDEQVDEGASAQNSIADLEWLIGSWTAEEHGAKTESVCRWLGDKSFVERRYTTTGVDGAQTTGVQIIGWNAHDGHVQSWNFSPDGSFAVGVWSPVEDGWQATISGWTSDGAATAAVNRLQRLDDNAYVWQSVERSLGEDPLPDTDEVVLRRNPQK